MLAPPGIAVSSPAVASASAVGFPELLTRRRAPAAIPEAAGMDAGVRQFAGWARPRCAGLPPLLRALGAGGLSGCRADIQPLRGGKPRRGAGARLGKCAVVKANRPALGCSSLRGGDGVNHARGPDWPCTALSVRAASRASARVPVSTRWVSPGPLRKCATKLTARAIWRSWARSAGCGPAPRS